MERSSLHLANCLASDIPSPSERAQHAERILRVSTALLSLPDAQRDAVLHKYLAGLSQDEIAALIHHGLKALRGMLEEDGIG